MDLTTGTHGSKGQGSAEQAPFELFLLGTSTSDRLSGIVSVEFCMVRTKFNAAILFNGRSCFSSRKIDLHEKD